MTTSEFEEFWKTVSVYTAWGWVIGAVVVLIALVKLWPYVRRSLKIIDAILLLPALVDEVKIVKHQVMPNGGDSLADTVNELAKGQVHIKRQNASLKTTVARVDRKLEDHILLVASNRVDDQKGDD